VSARVLKVFRAFLSIDVKHNLSNHDLLQLFELPVPANLVIAERVALLCRITDRGTPQLKAALAAAWTTKEAGARSWLPDAIADVQHIASVSKLCSDLDIECPVELVTQNCH
jgi:hypothetical protein